MQLKHSIVAAALTICAVLSLTAKTVVIEDFDDFANTEDLRKHWNSFGSAASSGPASLEAEMGYVGSNAALFNLNWDAGDNANMRMIKMPKVAQDLGRYATIIVLLQIAKDSGDYDNPSIDTKLRLAIQGGSDDTIWQTKPSFEVPLNSRDFEAAEFSLLDTEMIRISGNSSLSHTLSDVKNIRLRFENRVEPHARQDVYVDSIVARTFDN